MIRTVRGLPAPVVPLIVAATALLVIVVPAIVPVVGVTQPNSAAARTDGRLDLVAQTAFVGDDPATIDLEVDAPAESTIRIQIFQAVTSREDVRAGYTGLGGQRPFSDFICDVEDPVESSPCRLNSTGEVLSVEIPDQEVGEILRVDQGALPVVVTLRSNAGEVIDQLITHLIVLEDQQQATLHIAFISDLSTPVAIQPDQTIHLDTQDLFERARRLADHPQVPITVRLQPETLQSLAAGGQLNEFVELLTGRPAHRPVLSAPWVELDEEAWRIAGGTEMILEQYRYGAAVFAELLGRSPERILQLDTDATPRTLALARRVGTDAVIVQPGRITVETTNSSEFAPLRLRDSNGLGTTAAAIDDSLRQTLNHPDPELAGHRALTELAVEASNATVDRAVLVDFDQLDAAALDVLLDGIDERSSLQTSSVARALRVPVARNTQGRAAQARLQPTPAPDLSLRSANIANAQRTVDAYASMIAPVQTPVVELETLLRAAAAQQLSDRQSSAYTLSVIDSVLAGTANITIEPLDRITLTDRQAELLITVHNGQPLPITVELLLSAEKLRFADGRRSTRTLAPGDNTISVRVETLASGDARVTVAVTSLDGRLELAEGVINIRSTAISGLGLVISIIALIVLGGWWARTIRRVRRNRAAASVVTARLNPDQEQPDQEEP